MKTQVSLPFIYHIYIYIYICFLAYVHNNQFYKWEMLTSALRALVKNPVKKKNYGKKKFNVLTVFFISHKCDVKTFLKLIINKCPKGIR